MSELDNLEEIDLSSSKKGTDARKARHGVKLFKKALHHGALVFPKWKRQLYRYRQMTKKTKKTVLVIAAVLILSTNVQATECHSKSGDGKGWSWRTIDGKRCWYRGPSKIDKKKLSWKKKEVSERQKLLESVWP